MVVILGAELGVAESAHLIAVHGIEKFIANTVNRVDLNTSSDLSIATHQGYVGRDLYTLTGEAFSVDVGDVVSRNVELQLGSRKARTRYV